MSKVNAPDPICCIVLLEAVEQAEAAPLQAAWLADDPLRAIAAGAHYRRSRPLPSEERGFKPRGVYGAARIRVDGLPAAIELCRRVAGAPLPRTRVTVIAARELAVIDGPEVRGGSDGIKGWFFSSRRPGMSVADFQRHWRDVHGPLVVPSPGITRYVQYHPCPETYDTRLTPRFDSLAELSFPDADAKLRFDTSEHSTVHQRNDLPNLWDMSGGAMRFYIEDVGGSAA
ncbi:MAG: EthD domain-containing protein [Gammaproteobacteria bacterium]